ncbi:hypothetical protein [Streptomyces sp. NPDC008240]
MPETAVRGGRLERMPQQDGRLLTGHPECLATHIPPTDVEREVWSGLNLI